jgi:hypothetical protein
MVRTPNAESRCTRCGQQVWMGYWPKGKLAQQRAGHTVDAAETAHTVDATTSDHPLPILFAFGALRVGA